MIVNGIIAIIISIEVIIMISEISAMDLRKEIGHFLNEVKYRNNSYVIKRGKEEMCAIINIQLFNRLRDLESNYQKINTRLAAIGEKLTAAEIEQLVNEAVSFARKK
jgi:hypothetical protein